MVLPAKTKYKPTWQYMPNENMLRRMCSSHVYRKAASGYNSGWIVHAAILGKRMEVKVHDRSTYLLYITESYNAFDYSCTCGNTSVFYESCPHLIASLMHLMDNFEMMLEDETNREEGARYMLAHASSKQIADFLVKQMLEGPIMIDTFAREFGLCNVRLPRDYAREIDRMYSRIPKYGIGVTPIDFEPLFLEARSRQQGKEASEATRMYQDMSVSIRNHMKDVNDSDGYYADCCIEALENLVESVIRERLSHKDKQVHIKYLLDEFMSLKDIRFISHYRSALENICTAREDLDFWKDLMVPCLEDHGPVKKTNILGNPVEHIVDSKVEITKKMNLVTMYAHVLEQAGMQDKALAILAEHMPSDKDICIKYLYMLKDSDPDVAINGVQKALGAFPDDVQVMAAAHLLLPEDSAEYAALLRDLFVATGDSNHLQNLKKVSDDWDDLFRKWAAGLVKHSPEIVMDMCIKEKMYAMAMDMLNSVTDLNVIEKYYAKFAKKYSKRYFVIYGKALEKFIRSKSGKDHYIRVSEHLAKIKGIPDTEYDYDRLFRRIKSHNAGKRLLMKTLKGR